MIPIPQSDNDYPPSMSASPPPYTIAPSPTDDGLVVENLRVDYDNLTAVNGVSFHVPSGSLFGLVGPNGAGKTSIIRVLATLLQPTYGSVRAFGIDILDDPWAIHPVIGYMPDLAPVIGNLKVFEFLEHFAACHGLSGVDRTERVRECLDHVGMTAQRSVFCNTLSRGMMQRVVLAKTLLHQPRILLLDEPASGMDPLARIDLRDTLLALARKGCVVILSSHILADLADMCTGVAIMHLGRLRYVGPLDGFTEEPGKPNARRTVEFQTTLDSADKARAWLLDSPLIASWAPMAPGKFAATFEGEDAEQAAILRQMIETAGIQVLGFRRKSATLEDMLKTVTRS